MGLPADKLRIFFVVVLVLLAVQIGSSRRAHSSRRIAVLTRKAKDQTLVTLVSTSQPKLRPIMLSSNPLSAKFDREGTALPFHKTGSFF